MGKSYGLAEVPGLTQLFLPVGSCSWMQALVGTRALFLPLLGDRVMKVASFCQTCNSTEKWGVFPKGNEEQRRNSWAVRGKWQWGKVGLEEGDMGNMTPCEKLQPPLPLGS